MHYMKDYNNTSKYSDISEGMPVFQGLLNRLTGIGGGEIGSGRHVNGPCRRATQKFCATESRGYGKTRNILQRGKLMTPKFKLFQAGFYSLLAITLSLSASPARSEMLDLACASTGEGSAQKNIRLKIDTDRKIVTEIGLSGAFGEFNSPPYAATVSEQFIKYEGPGAGNSDWVQEGTIDRIAGSYHRILTHKLSSSSHATSYACRRATQKF